MSQNPDPGISSTPGPGSELPNLATGGGPSRMPRTPDELARAAAPAATGGAATTAAASAEARPLSELSRRIMAAWGKLWAQGVQVLSGAQVRPEHEHAELVGESLLAVARHGSTGLSPAAEARLDLGASAGLVVVDALLKRLDLGLQKRREAAEKDARP